MNETKKDKFASFLKGNIETFILVAICAVYIFRGIADIQESGKTVWEIIADGAVAFAFGYIVKAIMGKKGMLNGLISPKFIATTNQYGDQKIKIQNYVEELTTFCDKKNDSKLKQTQIDFLIKHAMNYNLFISGFYDDDKSKKRILKKCRKIKVFEYTPTLITNAYDSTTDEKEMMNVSISKYQSSQLSGNLIIGGLSFVLFGYFTLGKNAFDWAKIEWYALQVMIFLANGFLKQMNAYFFVTETLRGKVKRVMDIIDEFMNLRAKSPGIFAVEWAQAKKETPIAAENQCPNKGLTSDIEPPLPTKPVMNI